MRTSFLKLVCNVGLTLLLGACTSPRIDPVAERAATAIESRLAEAQASLRERQASKSRVLVQEAPQFTSKSIPVDRSQMLPPRLSNVTLVYPGRHNLTTLAELIERSTGIPVVITPDALLDPRAFAPIGGAAGGASTSGSSSSSAKADEQSANLLQALADAGGGRLALTPDLTFNTFELNHRGPLSQLLDSLATRARLTWSFEGNRILLRRVITRAIAVKTLPGSMKASGSLSISAGGASGGSSSSSSELSVDVWESLDKTVPLLVSAQGSVVIDPRLGMVVVRDAVENVEAVERLVAQYNAQFSRQVSLHVEVLQVDLSAEHQSGIDWGYVSGALSSISGARLQVAGAPSLVTRGGGVSLLLPGSASGARGSAILQALEAFGRVSTAYSNVLSTINRQPVPFGVLNTRAYVKSIEPATVSVSGTGATTTSTPGITPGEFTTGFTLSLMPVVLDSNRILLQTSISLSSLRELKEFSSGSSGLVQQPNVDSFSTMQRMVLSPGDTAILVGFESDETRNSRNDLNASIPGSRSLTNTRKSTVVLITPRLLDL